VSDLSPPAAGTSRRERVDISANVRTYLSGRSSTARYTSFDYCFNYFRTFREADDIAGLARDEQLQMSCLQLGFYLASWGMFRGKAELLQHSAKRLCPVIEVIVQAPTAIWDVDVDSYGPDVQALIFDVARGMAEVLPGGRSSTLVTKTMLGVFGCVPAFDRYFREGFGASTFGRKALSAIGAYYRMNAESIEACRIPTLDFTTGDPTSRRYTAAKVVDMVFFIEGATGGARKPR
jgi:hypothetical protein